jgi:NAD dependent epimerase/dehydratase family enzyme
MTLSPDPGGVFDTLRGLTRRGLGGRAGDGRQFMSWIHEADFVAAVQWLIDREDIDGVVNVAAPHPLPNAEFMRILREACGVPFGLPASRWMLELGAMWMRTETELILKSRRVVPARLLEHGFTFRYPEWHGAADDLCRRARAEHLLHRMTMSVNGSVRFASDAAPPPAGASSDTPTGG